MIPSDDPSGSPSAPPPRPGASPSGPRSTDRETGSRPTSVRAEASPRESSACPLRVLVVDDDELVRLIIRRALSKARPRVQLLQARTLEEARATLAEHTVQCVILDLGLPDGNGRDLLVELEAMGLDSPATVVLSGQRAEEVATPLLSLGAEDYLVKSAVEPSEISRAVTFALERHRLRHALKARNLALAEEVHRDPLTGLLNRRGLSAALEQASTRGRRYGILVDLDDFKAINDRFGHDVGDTAILAAAEAIRRATRPEDLLCRVGGDEFAIVCEATHTRAPLGLAQRICQAVGIGVSAVPALAGAGHGATASVGLAALEDTVATGSDVLAACTHAVHSAKDAGKGCVRLTELTTVQSGLADHSLVAARFQVRATPIRDLGTRAIEGWEYSIHPPAEFRGSTHDYVQRVRATRQLEEMEAASLRARIRAAGSHAGTGAVVLPLTADGLLAAEVQQQLEALARGPRPVVVSLWENSQAWSPTEVQAVVARLRRAGVGFGLARVGRGATSLEALLCLAPSLLRLDPTAAMCDPRTTDGRARLRVLAGLAMGVGARVVYPSTPDRPSPPELQALGVAMATDPAVELGVHAAEA